MKNKDRTGADMSVLYEMIAIVLTCLFAGPVILGVALWWGKLVWRWFGL